MAIEKNMDTWRSKWKKEKKYGHMKVQEKRKDSHFHKRVKREREDHAKWSYNKSDGNN
jgi:hypothetical protein